MSILFLLIFRGFVVITCLAALVVAIMWLYMMMKYITSRGAARRGWGITDKAVNLHMPAHAYLRPVPKQPKYYGNKGRGQGNGRGKFLGGFYKTARFLGNRFSTFS